MIEQLEWYSLLSLNHIPTHSCLIAGIVFCVGTAAILRLQGIKRGWRYSMALLLMEFMLLIYGSTVFFRETEANLSYDFNLFRNYQSTRTYLRKLPEIILNLVLFVPIGFLLGVVYRRMTRRKALLTGACLSMSIEILQLIFRKGCCDINDLLFNTLGCILGFAIFHIVHSLWGAHSNETL